MGLIRATLGDRFVTRARVTIPAWGCWYADVAVDGEVALTGRQTLKIADATFVGTILSGGASKGRSFFRIVGGAGGWGKTLPKKSYANDAGVKAITVLGDAAVSVGETLDASTLPATVRLGPAWVRPADEPASRLLEQISPSAWYVDLDGTTKIGKRAASTLQITATRIEPVDRARAYVELAADSIATLVPGVVVDGISVVDVQHDLTPKGLRTKLWGSLSSNASRTLDAFRALLDQLDPNRRFRGTWEYRVVTREGNRLNVQPVRVSTGMPDLQRVPVRPGVAGCKADVALGSHVLVQFIDEDPARPYVSAFEDADGEGFIPDVIKLGGGSDFVALAARVATELGAIRTTYNSHTHAVSGGTAAPTGAQISVPGSVAASKVKAT